MAIPSEWAGLPVSPTLPYLRVSKVCLMLAGHWWHSSQLPHSRARVTFRSMGDIPGWHSSQGPLIQAGAGCWCSMLRCCSCYDVAMLRCCSYCDVAQSSISWCSDVAHAAMLQCYDVDHAAMLHCYDVAHAAMLHGLRCCAVAMLFMRRCCNVVMLLMRRCSMLLCFSCGDGAQALMLCCSDVAHAEMLRWCSCSEINCSVPFVGFCTPSGLVLSQSHKYVGTLLSSSRLFSAGSMSNIQMFSYGCLEWEGQNGSGTRVNVPQELVNTAGMRAKCCSEPVAALSQSVLWWDGLGWNRLIFWLQVWPVVVSPYCLGV